MNSLTLIPQTVLCLKTVDLFRLYAIKIGSLKILVGNSIPVDIRLIKWNSYLVSEIVIWYWYCNIAQGLFSSLLDSLTPIPQTIPCPKKIDLFWLCGNKFVFLKDLAEIYVPGKIRFLLFTKCFQISRKLLSTTSEVWYWSFIPLISFLLLSCFRQTILSVF